MCVKGLAGQRPHHRKMAPSNNASDSTPQKGCCANPKKVGELRTRRIESNPRVKPRMLRPRKPLDGATSTHRTTKARKYVRTLAGKCGLQSKSGGVEGHYPLDIPSSCQANGYVDVLYSVGQKPMEQRRHADTDHYIFHD